MKKLLVGLSAILLVFGIATKASADPFFDIQNGAFLSVDDQNPYNNSYSATFNLDSDLLNSYWSGGSADINAEDDITSAVLTISLRDDHDYETLVIYHPGYYTYHGWFSMWHPEWYEYRTVVDSDDSVEESATITKEGDNIIFNNVVDGTLSFDVLADVSKDHALSFIITVGSGDFIINAVTLSGDYTDNPTSFPIPEPATMLLLGSGLVGIVRLRNRFMKK